MRFKRNATLATCITAGLVGASPSFAGDTEVEQLRREVAALKKMIEEQRANQPAAPQSPVTASDAEARLRERQKEPISAPAAVPAPISSTPAIKAYGVADVSIVEQNSGYGPKMRIEGSGGMTASRLGLQATSMLSGVKVTAVAEAGVQFATGSTGAVAPTPGVNDTGLSTAATPGTGGQIWSRQIWAGIDAGFGQLSIGRQYTGAYIAVSVLGHAHGDGLYGAATLTPLLGMPTRLNNSLVWATPQVANLRGILSYTSGSDNNLVGATTVGATSTSAKAGQGYDLTGIYSYTGGQTAVSVWNVYNTSWVTAGETGLAKKKGFQVAGNFDFGAFKLFGDFVHGTINGGNYQNVTKAYSDGTGYGASILVPFGKSQFIATWTHLDDRSSLNRDGSVYALSYLYSYSANATLYATAGKMENARNSSYTLTDGGNLEGNVSRPGFSPTGIETGLNFKF